MLTSWSEREVSEAFETYRDLPEEILGYRTVFEKLQPQRTGLGQFLDYGCGPGKVALRFAERTGKRVIAIDESPEMIGLANSKRSHPLIDYRLIENDDLGALEDHSLDGAMICMVIINTATEERIAEILSETHSKLKSGAPVVTLDTNPDSTGVEFSTFRNGQPGKHYSPGELREERLRIPGKPDLVLKDRHWSKEVYHAAFRKVGFKSVEQYEPTLYDVPGAELQRFEASHGFRGWRGEWERPPFVVFRAFK